MALKFDVFARQLGFARLGAEDWEAMQQDAESADAVVMVEAFVRGINWAAKQRPAHGEMFMLTRSKWQDLTPGELMGMARLVGFGMSFGWQHMLVRQWLHDVFGELGEAWSNTSDLSPEVKPTVDPEMSEAFARLSMQDLSWVHSPENRPRGEGSNWFVVDGKRSATGKPMLAGDPHLKVKIPDFWYQVCYRGALNVTGLAIFYLPGVNIGHNGNISWSVTLGYSDIEDVYLERFAADGRYQHKGEWKEPECRTETFKVKGEAEPRHVVVRRTVHGPVLEDSVHGPVLGRLDPMEKSVGQCQQAQEDKQASDGFTYKLSYAGLPVRPRSKTMIGVRTLCEARDFSSFDKALSFASTSICLNFAYADVEGNIGYVLTGEVPLGRGQRGDNTRGGDEWFPLCGWSGTHDYTGWLPHEQLPKAFNPPAGMIVSANHRIVDYDHYQHWLGLVFKGAWRARAIHEHLEGAGLISLDDMKAAQQSVLSIAAREFVEVVCAAQAEQSGLDATDKALACRALDALRGWDGRLEASSAQATLYQVMHREVASLLLQAGVRYLQAAKARPQPEMALPDTVIPAALLRRDESRRMQPESVPASGWQDLTVLEAVLSGKSGDSIFKMKNELDGHLHGNVLRMLRAGRDAGKREHRWWVTEAGGFDSVVCTAAASAQAFVDAQRDPSWGLHHTTTLFHPLTAALGFKVGTFLDVTPLQFGGDTNTPAQTATTSMEDLSANASHVSARVLFDLSDLAGNSWVITPLGVCEIAGSPYQSNNTPLWHGGEYRKLLWRLEDIHASTKHTTTFGHDRPPLGRPLLRVAAFAFLSLITLWRRL